jgi:hypothetical protein
MLFDRGVRADEEIWQRRPFQAAPHVVAEEALGGEERCLERQLLALDLLVREQPGDLFQGLVNDRELAHHDRVHDELRPVCQ